MPKVSFIDVVRHVFRRLGQAKTVGARALIFNQQGHVLLVKHTYREGWHTPGGGVNAGESPMDAIHREMKEETGLTPTTEPILFAVYRNRWQGLDDYPILYIIKDQLGEPVTHDPAEIAEVRWFPTNNLPADTTCKTRQRINEALGHQPVSQAW